MTTEDLMAVLAERGVTLTRHGDRLSYHGPENAVTPALINVLRFHKDRLLELIEDGGESPSGPPQESGGQPAVMIGLCWPGGEQPYKLVSVDEYFAAMNNWR